MDIRKVVDSIRETEVVALCQELLRIVSVNPPGDEIRIAEYVGGILGKAGLEVEIIPHGPERASLLAVLKSSRKIPPLLYSAHLDTVPLGVEKWIHEPFDAVISEGRIWGRGAADMKGGMAALIVAATALAQSGLPLRGDLILALTAGEEVDSLGATAIASRTELGPAQAVVIPEPSDNDVYIAEKGALWLELSTQGKTAHGAMPELGDNAVLMMVDLITELQKLKIPFKEHAMLGGFSMSVNTIQGGMKTNVVPDGCVVTVDMRTVPGQSHEAIVLRIKEMITGLSRRNSSFRASVKITNDRPPVETSPKEAAVGLFAGIVEEVLGKRPTPKGVRYYTDATALAPAFKAPMIICGPGDPKLAHQPNEYIVIEKLVQAVKIYTLTAGRFLI
ncbi:MAG TPA: M20 family metallopeptidase [Syntrophales bacterium]|nr:M20 family metallopeptidase [Syntrophales bacterium]